VGKYLARVPVGVWIGALVVLGGAWTKDGWGFTLGIIIMAATAVTSSAKREDAELPQDDAASDAAKDDGWGTGTDAP
jgi:hypothetical protein